MKFKSIYRFAMVLLAVLLLVKVVLAQDVPGADGIRGGRLYDNWFVILDVLPPEGDHPLWQTQDSNLRSGTVTWRCSTCHGWDYKGADGAYGLNSAEYTGFPGVLNMVGTTNLEILAWLNGSNNPDHDFSELMNPGAFIDLIAFLRTKQVDVALIIDYQDKSALGRPADGRELFDESCALCHGEDGSALNFNTAQNPIFIGDVALDNPWKFVHRVRFGSLLTTDHSFELTGWSLPKIADTLAYSQKLPPGNPLAGQPVLIVDDQTLDYSGQGDMSAINIAAVVIVLVILLGLVRISYQSKS